MSFFTVKTEQFEGPLDLLLSLVEKRKLLINEFSLASVADEYLRHIGEMKEFPVRDAANFLLVASTLVLIKSRSLIPELPLSSEEEADVLLLEQRLRMYKRIKEVSAHVNERFGKQFMFGKVPTCGSVSVFAPDKETNVGGLVAAAKRVLSSLPKIEKIPETIVRKVVSIEEMMNRLSKRMEETIRTSFRDFAKVGRVEKVEVVVGFLAMLELVKQGSIDVIQESTFGDIHMESKSVGVPRYN